MDASGACNRGQSVLILLFLALTGGLLPDVHPAHAQVGDTSRASLLVNRVLFEGNSEFSDERLADEVRVRPNSLFLGIPGATWWLWLYQWGNSGTFGEHVGHALEASGEPPAYLNPQALHTDAERLRRFYARQGYREAEVQTALDTLAGAEEVNIHFRIDPGPAAFLHEVDLVVDGPLEPAVAEELRARSVLREESATAAGATPFVVEDLRYTESLLRAERQRVIALLRQRGYAAVTVDSIRAVLEPASRAYGASARDEAARYYDLTFMVHPGPRYRFGDVRVTATGPGAAGSTSADTLAVGNGRLYIRLQGATVLGLGLLQRSVRVEPGALYDEDVLVETKRALEATGVFSYTTVAVPLQEASRRGGMLHVPVHVGLHTRPRHQLGFDTFVQQQRGGVLSPGDNQIGAGMGVSYENVNLFGGGESLRLETTGAVAFGAEAELLTASRGEVSASLTLPYLMAPLGGLRRGLDLYDARTRLSLGLLTARNDRLRLVIRGRGRTRLQLEMQHTPTLTSWVDLMDLTLSNPDTLRGFHDQFLERVIGEQGDLFVSDPVQRAQIISDYTQPQINDVVRYTLRSSQRHPIRHREGHRYEASLEAGGYGSSLLDRQVYTPDRQEGTLPGLPPFNEDLNEDLSEDADRHRDEDRSGSARLRYRPYVRATVDVRRYHALSPATVLVWRTMAGAALATGYSDLVPFDRRFYSGGATSVRGWRLRELGPGATRTYDAVVTSDRTVTSLLGGNIKLEANLELRRLVLADALKAQWWGVLFADAGNVWFGPRNPGSRGYEPASAAATALTLREGGFEVGTFYRQIGVGAGVGVRASWHFLVARLDLAYRVYDPAYPEEGLFPANYRRPVLHFGIGHSF